MKNCFSYRSTKKKKGPEICCVVLIVIILIAAVVISIGVAAGLHQCKLSQQTPDIRTMLAQCWPSVVAVGPTLNQHLVQVLRSLVYYRR